MILFFNTKITDSRLHGVGHHRHPWFQSNGNRLVVFKYCLASYVPLKPFLKKVIFYLELGSEFQDNKEELEEYIFSLYPNCELYWFRNDNALSWKEACEKHFNDDDIIWYHGNDDHIFIDYNLDIVEDIIHTLKNDPDPLATVYYSHWPEQCLLSKHLNAELTPSKNLFKFTWANTDGLQILKGKKFKLYWEDPRMIYTNDPELPSKLIYDLLHRTDPIILFAGKDVELRANYYAPVREIVRHYDGYSHIVASTDLNSNTVPPLIIPDGFFERDIKIRIGYRERKPGYVTFNSSCDLYSGRPWGIDYRWLQSDIPLFWRDRITEIDFAPNYDIVQDSIDRDNDFIKNTRLPMYAWAVAFNETNGHPIEMFEKHLKAPKQ